MFASCEAAIIGTVRTVHFDLLQTTVVPGSPEAPLDSALSGSPWASLMPPALPEVRVQGMAYPTSSYLKHINNDYNWIPSTMGSFSLTMYSNSPKMEKQKPTIHSVNVVFATFFLVTIYFYLPFTVHLHKMVGFMLVLYYHFLLAKSQPSDNLRDAKSPIFPGPVLSGRGSSSSTTTGPAGLATAAVWSLEAWRGRRWVCTNVNGNEWLYMHEYNWIHT